MKRATLGLSTASFLFALMAPALADETHRDSIYARQNLVAWCIVPFDAAKRGPNERAKMLQRLGITKVAYDWRAEHVPTFEEEILAYKKHGLEFFAFWDEHPQAFELFQKHQITPQIWKMLSQPEGKTDATKTENAAKQLMPLVLATRKLGCKLGLYNHGGWSGEPQNLVAVCEWLRANADGNHVGIVYNFHHGHDRIGTFQRDLKLMKPYLLCLNLNGMNDQARPKILPIGSGQHEARMMALVRESGYSGPIGILDHRSEIDAEKSLRENLVGLRKLLAELDDDTE